MPAKTIRRSGGRDNANQDRPAALLAWQAGRGQPDDDGVVAGQHQIDHDDLEEGGESKLA